MVHMPVVNPTSPPQTIRPPGTWRNDPDHFLTALSSQWYPLMIAMLDVITHASFAFWREQQLKLVHLPITTRTVTCPTGLGSDSMPVPVTVNGEETYLADSMQFLLEYGCRAAPHGCGYILPSFRGEQPDETHLQQFIHLEAEIPGGLDDILSHVEALLRRLAQALLTECGAELAAVNSDLRHVEKLAESAGRFTRIRFDEAVGMLTEPGLVRVEDGWRSITRLGERRLMSLLGEFVWVSHWDHLAVPFYQAFEGLDQSAALNADLFFGVGEVVGCGERHVTGDEVRTALATHGIRAGDYQWYVRMKDEIPMRTAGFGLGVERLMLWLVGHDDIRDIPLVTRLDGPSAFPRSVGRP
jgi:asparaginyl-tRNA synthetase